MAGYAVDSFLRLGGTTLDPLLTLPAPIIGTLTGLLAGLQPSWRAARITPATALRSE